MIGKPFIGYLSKSEYIEKIMDTFTLNLICLIFRGLAAFLLLFCETYERYCFVIFIYGFLSAHMILTPQILMDLHGKDNLNSATSIYNMFKGTGIVLGSPCAGLLFDSTKNYHSCIIVACAFFFTSVMLCVIVKIVDWLFPQNIDRNGESATSQPGLEEIENRRIEAA